MSNDIQKIENNNGQNALNVSGDQIFNQYNYAKEEAIYTVFINPKSLTSWYEDRNLGCSSCIVETEENEIIHSIKLCHAAYLKNKNISLKVETPRLKSAELNLAECLNEYNEEIKNIERIETLIMLINLNIIDIKEERNEFIIINILDKIYNIHEYSRLMFSNNLYFNDKEKVTNFLYSIYEEEEKKKEFIKDELSKNEKFNKHIETYLLNFSPRIKSINDTIQKKTNAFLISFKNIYQWLNIPFDCMIKGDISIFNSDLISEKKMSGYNFLINNNDYLKINLYTTLILRYSFNEEIRENGYDFFYINNNEKFNIVHTKEQKELIRVMQSFVNPSILQNIKEPDSASLNYWKKNMLFYFPN